MKYAIQAVKWAAQGRWPGILTASGISPDYLTGKHSKCPGCGGRDRFRYCDESGTGSFLCSQGGAGLLAGDGFTLLRHVYGWRFKEALIHVAEHLGITPQQGRAHPRRRYEGRYWQDVEEIRHALLVADIAASDRARGRLLTAEDAETERQAIATVREFLRQGGQLNG